jgi:KDO2-lipid IV(A) lauroyltransferase
VATQAPPPHSAFLAPRHWPTWLGIGLLCLIAWLPFRLRMAAGKVLGWATWLLAHERRYITEVNIRLCFPELGRDEQAALVREAFSENGIGLIETATGWIRPARHFFHIGELRGGELLQQGLDRGKGVLLLGGHYSTLDFSANLLSLYFPFAVTYRAHRNPLFDAFMLRGRIRNCNGVFDRKDIRGAFRHLKQNKLLWYAPDQDYGPEQAVYAPFFGQQAATITAGTRFANFNDSAVCLVSHRRLTNEKRYVLDIVALPGFPSGDDRIDAQLVNGAIEREIRKAPAQYLWMHKRFKTQPGGKPESPYIFIKTPQRMLSPQKYAELTEGAVPVPGHRDRELLSSGLQLWRYPLRQNSLQRLDRLSKHLRSHGLATVTVDSLYRFPHLNQAAATVFVPAGESIAGNTMVVPSAAASFLASLHGAGCSFTQVTAANLLWDGTRLALLDPLVLRHYPGSTAQAWRLDDLRQLTSVLGFNAAQQAACSEHYLAHCRPADRTTLAAAIAAQDRAAHNTTMHQ